MVNVTSFINETGTIHTIIEGLTNNVTGAPFLTFLLLYLIVISMCMAFKIEIEFSAVLLLPLTLLFMAYSGEFLGLATLMIAYLGILIAKNFWLSK